jgi:hypothetical protein
MSLMAPVTEHNSWFEVEYLILCEGKIPAWVAKIEEIVMPKIGRDSLLFRFSEVKSVKDESEERQEEYGTAFSAFYKNRNSDRWPLLITFENDQFFTIGSPVQLKAQPHAVGALSMESAILQLAETYTVNPSQVEIIIRSAPVIPPKKMNELTS